MEEQRKAGLGCRGKKKQKTASIYVETLKKRRVSAPNKGKLVMADWQMIKVERGVSNMYKKKNIIVIRALVSGRPGEVVAVYRKVPNGAPKLMLRLNLRGISISSPLFLLGLVRPLSVPESLAELEETSC